MTIDQHEDLELRLAGWQIAERPRHGPAFWRHPARVSLYQHGAALKMARDELRRRQLEAGDAIEAEVRRK